MTTTSTSQGTQELLPEQAEPVLIRERASGTLSNSALAEQCLLELEAYRRGEPCDESYGLELFRRATVDGDSHSTELMSSTFRNGSDSSHCGEALPDCSRPQQ